MNDRYWEERFTLVDSMVPIFMDKQKQKVLHAGKYLFVIKECGRLDIKNPMESQIGQMTFGKSKVSQTSHGEIMQIDTGVDVDMEAGGQQQDGHHSNQYEFMDHIEAAYVWNS